MFHWLTDDFAGLGGGERGGSENVCMWMHGRGRDRVRYVMHY